MQHYGPLDKYALAEKDILNTYGDEVSFYRKGKSLTKFGKTLQANASVPTTVAVYQDAVVNETYATSNSIDYVVSTSASDTAKTATIEGHYLSGTDLVFAVQTVTLTGQTPVALTQPLCRATRVYNSTSGTIASPAADFVGAVSVYDATLATGTTAGKANVDEAVKVMTVAGENQSQKCSTSLSYLDYWALSGLSVGIERTSGAGANVDIEIFSRRVGSVWRPIAASLPIRTATASSMEIALDPLIIIPKNSDVRVVATSDTNATVVHASLFGRLGKVITNRAPL